MAPEIETDVDPLKSLFDSEIEDNTDPVVKAEDDSNNENGKDTDKSTDDKPNDNETPLVDEPTGPSTEELQNDIQTLRTMVQEQGQLITTLTNQSDGLVKDLSDKGHIDTETLAGNEDDSAAINDRLSSLAVLAESMAVSPQYPNFADVCSQVNVNRVIDGLAQLAMQEEGGTLTDHVNNVTESLWDLPNPYKFVYDILTEHDPKYAPAQVKTDAGTGAVEVPETLSNLDGGNADGSGGWTAAKIDAMAEEELHKVPANVYDKYMANNLK